MFHYGAVPKKHGMMRGGEGAAWRNKRTSRGQCIYQLARQESKDKGDATTSWHPKTMILKDFGCVHRQPIFRILHPWFCTVLPTMYQEDTGLVKGGEYWTRTKKWFLEITDIGEVYLIFEIISVLPKVYSTNRQHRLKTQMCFANQNTFVHRIKTLLCFAICLTIVITSVHTVSK